MRIQQLDEGQLRHSGVVGRERMGMAFPHKKLRNFKR